MIAIILAGGKAIRMQGLDKAFLKIENEPLIYRQIRLLKKIFKKIIIVTNSPQKYKNLKGVNPVRNTKFTKSKNKISNGVKLISDVIPHQGPLGGIYAGLLASKDNYNFVLACDMPFIDTGLIKYMYEQATGYDVVIPKVNNKYEPLFSIYSKKCLKYIQELLEKRVFKIRAFFPQVKVKVIPQHKIVRFAPLKRIFLNINTPQDLHKLQ